jgi:hypothetical protein
MSALSAVKSSGTVRLDTGSGDVVDRDAAFGRQFLHVAIGQVAPADTSGSRPR